jgi:hypothetical protein
MFNGIWHIFTKPFAWARRAFLFGQVKHTYLTV